MTTPASPPDPPTKRSDFFRDFVMCNIKEVVRIQRSPCLAAEIRRGYPGCVHCGGTDGLVGGYSFHIPTTIRCSLAHASPSLMHETRFGYLMRCSECEKTHTETNYQFCFFCEFEINEERLRIQKKTREFTRGVSIEIEHRLMEIIGPAFRNTRLIRPIW